MLVDEIILKFVAGHGGRGRVSFAKPPQKGPDGGNGGKGGNIYIEVTSDLSALNKFISKKVIEAENGKDGAGNKMYGLNGKDLTIKLPVGSVLKNLENPEDQIELLEPGTNFLFLKGGLGGRGNFEFRSSRNTTPEYAQPGLSGQEKLLQITMRFIADFGLIGLPNSGKSSLLNELTDANVKTGNYAFTTLEANLGVLGTKIIADIPGIIEGAHTGKGLGLKFLKHIEKVNLLLHTISSESEDPLKDYKTIRTELSLYNKELLDKKEIILLTKTDLLDEKALKEKIVILKKLKREIIPISIHDLDSLKNLEKSLQ